MYNLSVLQESFTLSAVSEPTLELTALFNSSFQVSTESEQKLVFTLGNKFSILTLQV